MSSEQEATFETVGNAKKQAHQGQDEGALNSSSEGEVAVSRALAIPELFIQASNICAARAKSSADLQSQLARLQSLAQPSTMDMTAALGPSLPSSLLSASRSGGLKSESDEVLTGVSAMLALQRQNATFHQYQQQHTQIPSYGLNSSIQAQQGRYLLDPHQMHAFSTTQGVNFQQELNPNHQQTMMQQQLLQLMQLKPPDIPVNTNSVRSHGTPKQEMNKKSHPQLNRPIIAPCPARGMPIEHNFKAAYFIISNETKHGDELSCSYPSCRNSGIKFRYCSYCKMPAAKRNFAKTHAHAHDDQSSPTVVSQDKKTKKDKKTDRSETSFIREDTTPANNRINVVPVVSDESDISVNTSKTSMSSLDGKRMRPKSPEKKHQSESKRQRCEMISHHEDKNIIDESSSEKSESSRSKSSSDKTNKDRWNGLLEERPSSNDKRAMSDWLYKVLTVSEGK